MEEMFLRDSKLGTDQKQRFSMHDFFMSLNVVTVLMKVNHARFPSPDGRETLSG